jgi:wingless-type MMTV integration site family protein 5
MAQTGTHPHLSLQLQIRNYFRLNFSLRTCYQQLPTFREIGTYLKEKYDSAIEVRYQRRLGELRSRDRRFVGPTKDDLIYFEESNFCEYNPRIGSLGTKDRQCNRTSHSPDGCTTMCCGRGYNTIRKYIQEKCNCKFIWCCSVQCETCYRLVEINVCK